MSWYAIDVSNQTLLYSDEQHAMCESKRGLKDKLSKYNDVTFASLIKRPTQTAENNPGTTHVLTIDEDPPFCGENTRGDLDSSISPVSRHIRHIES